MQNQFLEEFTRELIINSLPEDIVKKLKQLKQEHKQQEIEEKTKTPRKIKINEGINKIALLLDNPAITMIECPGPNKYLIIEKLNKKTPLHLTLSKQEINQVIDYFSEKTNTERTPGTYKVALNNMVLTAISSEFGGHKFIITKTLSIHSRYL